MSRPTPSANDPFDLQRFVVAQEASFAQARAELAAGQKRSHWMWFIFPQLRGLGSSPMAQRYALSGLPEASIYLAHPVLGARLQDCTALVLAGNGRSVSDIFGYPDDLKFHSSMTLFAEAAAQGGEASSVFTQVLRKCLGGQGDKATLNLLRAG